jgi:hypothetical protein
MSVKLHEEADGRIMVLTLSGKLDKQDYAHFMPEVERAIKKHGKIRLLVEMREFHGWSLGAMWEAGMATFCKPFTTASVKYFDETKSNEASAWIHEGVVSESLPTGVAL